MPNSGISAIDTATPGRVPKAEVIAAIQATGAASYDQVRETLKEVEVDASGKVELEDWVDVWVSDVY
jgi:plastin-1